MKILLVGDYCTDCFLEGDVTRLSPEAPVPVFIPTGQVTTPGMAGNVLANLKSLAPDAEVIAYLPKVVNMKVRYVDRTTGHHFLRVDEPDQCQLMQANDFMEHFGAIPPDAVVVSDYCKGWLNEELLTMIGEVCKMNCVPLFVDTKRLLGAWSRWAIIKINESEAAEQEKTNEAFASLCAGLIVTSGADGMTLYDREGKEVYYSPAVGVLEVKDGAGCGDSVLAAITVRYLENGGDLKDAMDWANKVGAVAVSKRGVVAVKREDVK